LAHPLSYFGIAFTLSFQVLGHPDISPQFDESDNDLVASNSSSAILGALHKSLSGSMEVMRHLGLPNGTLRYTIRSLDVQTIEAIFVGDRINRMRIR
jgi:hypothetical protein